MINNSGVLPKMLVVLLLIVLPYAFIYPAFSAEPIILDLWPKITVGINFA